VAKLPSSGSVKTLMRARFHPLLMVLFACMGSAAVDGSLGSRAWAQTPIGSTRSDSSSRDHDRGRSGDRGRGDWRSKSSRKDGEHRGDEKRSDEKSPGTGSSASGSGTTSNFSGSTKPSSPASATSTSTQSSVTAINLNLKSYATRLVTEHDKNGNMILEPDEQVFLGRSAADVDLNHDGKITIDEIVMHHSAGASVASAPTSSTALTPSTSNESGRSGDHDRDRHRDGGYGRHDGGSGGDNRLKTDDPIAKRILTGTAGGIGKDADKRHSYRFSRATDRLPTGLPPWFSSRDSNKDGQVSMSEYSRSVSQSIVAEFRRYDANDDGIITAKEAAKQR
jgi:hypothetical protein